MMNDDPGSGVQKIGVIFSTGRGKKKLWMILMVIDLVKVGMMTTRWMRMAVCMKVRERMGT
jgi:hypothetical protein